MKVIVTGQTASRGMFIVWDDAFAIGHTELDAEHRHLVGIINAIYAAEDSGRPSGELLPLLNALTLATIGHFRHENSVLRTELVNTMTGDAINEHCAEHALALSELELTVRDFRTGTSFGEFGLSRKLRDWFHAHALGYDVDLAGAYQAARKNSQ